MIGIAQVLLFLAIQILVESLHRVIDGKAYVLKGCQDGQHTRATHMLQVRAPTD